MPDPRSKSHIFTGVIVSLFTQRMFSGFRSRCAMPAGRGGARSVSGSRGTRGQSGGTGRGESSFGVTGRARDRVIHDASWASANDTLGRHAASLLCAAGPGIKSKESHHDKSNRTRQVTLIAQAAVIRIAINAQERKKEHLYDTRRTMLTFSMQKLQAGSEITDYFTRLLL